MTISEQIDAQIASYPDWRGERLKWFRSFVHIHAPELAPDFKWGVGVFTHNGKPVIAFSGFKGFTKFNFFQGASLPDPSELFNSGLDSKQQRSINLRELGMVDEQALAELVRRASIWARKH
jgi:hypothetical protein